MRFPSLLLPKTFTSHNRRLAHNSAEAKSHFYVAKNLLVVRIARASLKSPKFKLFRTEDRIALKLIIIPANEQIIN